MQITLKPLSLSQYFKPPNLPSSPSLYIPPPPLPSDLHPSIHPHSNPPPPRPHTHPSIPSHPNQSPLPKPIHLMHIVTRPSHNARQICTQQISLLSFPAFSLSLSSPTRLHSLIYTPPRIMNVYLSNRDNPVSAKFRSSQDIVRVSAI